MITSEAGRRKIEAFESCVLHAYKARPSEKYFTIGYGHYGADVKADMTITQEEADAMFARDLVRYETAVNDTGMVLTQPQFDALVDFAYNCGTGALATVCKSKDLKEICRQIPNWCKDAGGSVLPGLKKNRSYSGIRSGYIIDISPYTLPQFRIGIVHFFVASKVARYKAFRSA